MGIRIEEIRVTDYERVVYADHPSLGLKTIIAIHNSRLGPACGGIRLLPYASKDEALQDVLRLSKGMTYKSALANIGFGGGKSVIIGDPKDKSVPLFEAFGEVVERLEGAYIAAKDMNIQNDDLLSVRKSTKHVLGLEGVPGSSGDPSPVTARGLLRALEATLEELNGNSRMGGLKIAIQGLGYVGFSFAQMVTERGAKIWACDTDIKRLRRAEKELRVHSVSVEEIYDVECDVFSPCARGAVLNTKTIPRLRCLAVVGCANNQLESDHDAFRLHERKILYAPDFAVNSGGIINIFIEYESYDLGRAMKKADGIYATMKEIYTRARKTGAPPFVLANELAEERIYGSKRA